MAKQERDKPAKKRQGQDAVDKRVAEQQQEFIKKFPLNLCNISATCTAVGISRQTYYDWIDKSDTFKKGCHDAEEQLKDNLESKNYKKAMVDEDTTMLIFLSKTKMRDRGYIERLEIDKKEVNPHEGKSEEQLLEEIKKLQNKVKRGR